METIDIHIEPDYNNALFWDKEGRCVGGTDTVHIDYLTIDLRNIRGLTKWYNDWSDESLYHTHKWNDSDWYKWWLEGLKIASKIRRLLPAEIKLSYMHNPYNIWSIKPEDTDDGGVFAAGEPFMVPMNVFTMVYPERWSRCAFYDSELVGSGDDECIYECPNEHSHVSLRGLELFQLWYNNPTTADAIKAAKEVRKVLPKEFELIVDVGEHYELIQNCE